MQSHSFLFLLPFRSLSPKPFLRSVASSSASVELSVSDAELASRGFVVRRDAEGLDVGALNDVFARAGLPRRDPAGLRRALALGGVSGAVVWVSASEAGAPVAFARATGDGTFNAVVWNVVVEPSHQGMGLGRAVVERVVAELRRKGIGNSALFAKPRVVGFYHLLGFAVDPDGIRGMVYSRKNQKRNS